jgi:hypothetical protein
LLRDRLNSRERIALETYRDARAALALIREAIEDCAPPGSVQVRGISTPVGISVRHIAIFRSDLERLL